MRSKRHDGCTQPRPEVSGTEPDWHFFGYLVIRAQSNNAVAISDERIMVVMQISYLNVSELCQAEFKFSRHYRLQSFLFCT